MKKQDYIILIVCLAAILTTIGISTVAVKFSNKAMLSYKLEEVQANDKYLAHTIDSVAKTLKAENFAILQLNARITAERDSIAASAAHSLSQIRYVYITKTNDLARLPDDSVLRIFAGQLSSGTHP
jgi:uncharacterized protein YkuJ